MDIRYEEASQTAKGEELLRLSQVPNIELYMDQIISLMEEGFGKDSSIKKEKPLTKTMIHNYSKEGLIKPIKGKKYSREHIVQMLMIYSLKNTLTMQSIKRLFDGFYGEAGMSGDQLMEVYERFVEEQTSVGQSGEDAISALLRGMNLDPEQPKDFMVTLLVLTWLSSYTKSLAETLIDQAFPLVDKKK